MCMEVSVYCARRIPAHLRYTQCSILLPLIDICFLSGICLWQISLNQTCLCVVVGPGFFSTSLTSMRSSASHPAGLHDRLAPKMVNHPVPFAQQFVTAVASLPLVDCHLEHTLFSSCVSILYSSYVSQNRITNYGHGHLTGHRTNTFTYI